MMNSNTSRKNQNKNTKNNKIKDYEQALPEIKSKARIPSSSRIQSSKGIKNVNNAAIVNDTANTNINTNIFNNNYLNNNNEESVYNMGNNINMGGLAPVGGVNTKLNNINDISNVNNVVSGYIMENNNLNNNLIEKNNQNNNMNFINEHNKDKKLNNNTKKIKNNSNITNNNNLSVINNNMNNPNTISKATDFINSVIHEYLLKKEYHKTLDYFQCEVDEKLRSRAYYLTSFSREYNDKALLKYFTYGEKNEFFTLFNSLFPIHVRKREETIKSLEFLLNIYFTVYPIAPYNTTTPQLNNITKKNNKHNNINYQHSSTLNNHPKLNQKNRELFYFRINEFKKYLEDIQSSGNGNFKNKEILSYFALPYITDIEINPAYKHLFEIPWVNNIKNQLTNLVKTFVPLGNTPLLYEIFNIYTQTVDNTKNIVINQINNLAFDKESDHEKINELTSEIRNLKLKEEGNKKDLIQSQVKWTKLAIEINTVAADILSCLKNIKNKPITKEFLESSTLKLNKYDFFLKKNLNDFDRAAGNSNINQSNIMSSSNNLNNLNSMNNINNNQYSRNNNNEESLLWGNQLNNNLYNNANRQSLNRSLGGKNKSIYTNNNTLNNLNQSDVFAHNNNNNNSHLLNNYNIVNYGGSHYLHNMENNSIFNESDEFNQENSESKMMSGVNNMNNNNNNNINSNNLNESGVIGQSNLNNINNFYNNSNFYNNNNFENNQKNSNLSKIQGKINQKELNYNSKYLLDIALIKEELGKLGSVTRNTKDSFQKIALIIKEIRFRLSKKRHNSIKQQTMFSILYYDLFALKSKKVRILSTLLESSITREETVKLLNVISTSAIGRDYILNKDTIVEELYKIMINEENDTPIRQNILGTLQKFTLRSTPQKKLIELEILNWCITTLISEQVTVSEYTLEYCLAMIMNLSLSKQGRQRCASQFSSLLKVILHHIHSESLHVRTCINGTLFSVLKIKQVREEARAKDLQTVLENKIKENINTQIKKQTQYILEELKKPETEEDEENNKQQEKEKEEEINTFNDDWGDNFLEETYQDDCNLNDTISNISENIGLINSSSENINQYNNFINSEEVKHIHNKAVEFFILKFETDNIEEIKKLNEFSSGLMKKKNLNRAGSGNLGGNQGSGGYGSGRVFSLEEFNKPLSRPITPMINKDCVGELNNVGKKKTDRDNNLRNEGDEVYDENYMNNSGYDPDERKIKGKQTKNKKKNNKSEKSESKNDNEDEENENEDEEEEDMNSGNNNEMSEMGNDEEDGGEQEDKGSSKNKDKNKKNNKIGYTFDLNQNEQLMKKDTKPFLTNNKIDRTPDQTIY